MLPLTLVPPLVLPVLPVLPLMPPIKRASRSSCRRGSRLCSSSIAPEKTRNNKLHMLIILYENAEYKTHASSNWTVTKFQKNIFHLWHQDTALQCFKEFIKPSLIASVSTPGVLSWVAIYHKEADFLDFLKCASWHFCQQV